MIYCLLYYLNLVNLRIYQNESIYHSWNERERDLEKESEHLDDQKEDYSWNQRKKKAYQKKEKKKKR